jgi:hypothetical protein
VSGPSTGYAGRGTRAADRLDLFVTDADDAVVTTPPGAHPEPL